MDAIMTSSSRDSQEERADVEGEITKIDEKPVTSHTKSTDVDNQTQDESRDDCGATERARNEASDRDEHQDVSKKPAKALTAPKHKKSTSDRSSQGRRNPQDNHQAYLHQNQGRGAVGYHPPHPTMHGNNGPRGHPTAASYAHHPYGYAANTGPHNPYRGPHQHHLPYPMPPMHPGQQAPYGAPGAFHPAQHHHPGYGAGPYHHPHPYPYHGAMRHQHPASSFQQANAVSSEDTGSIGSTKSKGSKSGKSTTGSSSSTNSQKKRTIDGVDQRLNVNAQQPGMTSAFTFRRTHSNLSTSSTVTAGNNTSTETPNLTEDSPKKGRDLPPLSSRPEYQGTALEDSRKGYHRRDFSETSTASSLSVGGLSLSSYDTRGSKDVPMMRSSPKRRRGHDGNVLSSNESSLAPGCSQNFNRESSRENLFLTLSTSPINSDVEATPVSKNTMKATLGASKSNATKADTQTLQVIPSSRSLESMDRSSSTPTPPLPKGSAESDMITDEHLLNRHLRCQSFTPLPHISQYTESREGNTSPPGLTQNPSFSTLGAQLSWDITGDAPSLGVADSWDDDRQPSKTDNRRPGSAGSAVSPAPFAVWKEGEMIPSSHYQLSGGDGKNYDNIRLSALSPHSDVDMEDINTPLPLFFDHQGRENGHHQGVSSISSRKDNQGPPVSNRMGQPQFGDPEHIHQLFVTNGGRGSDTKKSQKAPMIWNHPGHLTSLLGSHQMRFPPTPVFTSSEQDSFGRSPLSGERRDGPPEFFPYNGHVGLNSGGPNDRIRNLRGRAPPGSQRGPMAHHQLPPHLSSHPHNLTSPIGVGQIGKGPMWSPGGGMTHSLHSPHHLVQSDSPSSSKRKCIAMKPPIPTKFQGDIEKFKTAHVPEFTSLVNFPSNMSQSKQSPTLPDGVRCCVMCGQACPCSTIGKNKKNKANKASGDGSLAARNNNVQNAEKQGLAVIPTQNKGLCTLCDVNVWIVASSGLEIKWCKGCKNFRPWASFGDKGLATKCLRCRDRQREKYAVQKEEKERTRIVNKQNRV